MINIRHANTNRSVQTNTIFFGGGEKHVKILEDVDSAIISVFFENDSDLVTLLMYVDSLKRMGCKQMFLEIAYFPGARQDRVCARGEALSVKVYADLINSMNFQWVKIFDPHSDVTGAVLNNVVIVNNHEFIQGIINDLNKEFILISPDAGSNKKIYDLSKNLGGLPVIRCDKLRNVKTGEIIESIVYADEQQINGKNLLIVDDICSRGGTFKALAKKLKTMNPSSIYLAVSHFEGNANLTEMKECGIDGIYTTDSKPWNVNDYNKNNFIWEICATSLIA
jgi:ribose-phosphate pyrophosphokinase